MIIIFKKGRGAIGCFNGIPVYFLPILTIAYFYFTKRPLKITSCSGDAEQLLSVWSGYIAAVVVALFLKKMVSVKNNLPVWH